MGDVKVGHLGTSSVSSASTAQLVPVGQRARLRSFTVPSQTATHTYLNGSADGGTVVFNVAIGAEDQNPYHVNIPGDGILFDNGIGYLCTSADVTMGPGSIVITYEG